MLGLDVRQSEEEEKKQRAKILLTQILGSDESLYL